MKDRTKKKGYKEWTLPELSIYFNRPIRSVAKELDVSVTFLKKVCRRLKVNRWPFRKIQSIQRQMESCVYKCPQNQSQLVRLPFDIMKQIGSDPYYYLELLNKKASIKALVDSLCEKYNLVVTELAPDTANSVNYPFSSSEENEEEEEEDNEEEMALNLSKSKPATTATINASTHNSYRLVAPRQFPITLLQQQQQQQQYQYQHHQNLQNHHNYHYPQEVDGSLARHYSTEHAPITSSLYNNNNNNNNRQRRYSPYEHTYSTTKHSPTRGYYHSTQHELAMHHYRPAAEVATVVPQPQVPTLEYVDHYTQPVRYRESDTAQDYYPYKETKSNIYQRTFYEPSPFDLSSHARDNPKKPSKVQTSNLLPCSLFFYYYNLHCSCLFGRWSLGFTR
jgi:hypothetical protein